EVVVDVGVVVETRAGALCSRSEAVAAGYLEADGRIPAEVVAEKHSQNSPSEQLFIRRGEIGRQILLAELFGNPIARRSAVSDSMLRSPRGVQTESTPRLFCTSVLERRVFAPDDQRNLQPHGQA